MVNTQTQAAQAHANAPEHVQVVPSGKAVGAEIRGVDLSQPVPEASKELMRQAWADHGVLLWRDQKLPDISFLEAAAIFGVTKEPAARKYQVAVVGSKTPTVVVPSPFQSPVTAFAGAKP